ncbi:MAG: ABC transporter substrate-binding protein [Solibacillus sp.]
MKKLFVLLLSLTFLLAACGGTANESNVNSDAGTADGKLTKIQVITAAEGTPTYYAYVAKEKGFFAEEGLDVELVAGKGSSYVVQQIGAGTVDLGITAASSLVTAWDKGIDIKSVYQINVTNLFDLIVTPDSGINSVADLKGKIVGVSDLGGGEVPMVKSILAHAGLKADTDVTLRAIGTEAPSVLAAFEKGTVDAYSGGAHDLISLYGQGFKSNSLIPEEFKTLPSTAIIANGDFLAENPEVAAKFARAVARATDFSINNYDEVFAIMKGIFPEQYMDEKIANLFLETFIELSTPIEPEKGYGYIYEDAWQLMIDQFKGDDSVIQNDINLKDYLDSSLLADINNF